MGLIYRATNTVNGKVYIGKTTKTLNRRRTEHESTTGNIGKKFVGFKAAIQKYGKSSFIWEVLYECLDNEELSEKEKEFIELHKSNKSGYGYNRTCGGDGASYGELNPSKRPEVREKIRASNTGFKHSIETLEKMRNISLEYYKDGMTKEQRDKISVSVRKARDEGRLVYKSGAQHHSARSCILVDPRGKVHQVDSLREFSASNGLDHSSVSKLLNGKLKTHKGWTKYETAC